MIRVSSPELPRITIHPNVRITADTSSGPITTSSSGPRQRGCIL